MHTQRVVIRRGADVVGPEGPIGTVGHLVVDESTHELNELVVHCADGHDWVVPVRAIAGASDDTVRLKSNWVELRSSAYQYAADEFDTLPMRGPVPAHREADTQADTLELRQEELRVGKRARELGAVELRKEVVADRKGVDVPVWHDELIIEHQPVDPPRLTDDPFTDQAPIRVVLREEVAGVDTQPVVTETVRAGRRRVTETQHVDATVRKEVPDVRREGNVPVHEQTD